MIEEETCNDTDSGLSRIGCDKPRGHSGDRHGYNLGFMSAAWGYIPVEDEQAEENR